MNTKLETKTLYFLIAVSLVFWGTNALGGFSEIMNSTNYKISPDSINSGGTDNQTSTNYKMKDTIGEMATGTSDALSYYLKAGYREMVDILAVSPSPSPSPISEGGGPGPSPDREPPIIGNLLISKIAVDLEKITWETNEQALCKFYLGQTEQYEIENIEEITFYYQHEVGLKNLSPGQTYHFKISCRDKNYNSAQTADLTFIFSEIIGEEMIPNVVNLNSTADETSITLQWENPSFPDFEGVKIIKSDKFFPKSVEDGELVFDGKGNIFVDENVEKGKRYYYTVFTYDKSGRYSSGAVISDVPRLPGEPAPPFPEKPYPLPVPSEIEKLSVNDFEFFYGGKKIFPSEKGEIYVGGKKPLSLFLRYSKVPEVLKTIMVTLKKDDKFFSFILKANKEKSGYEATLMSPTEPGTYPLLITIMDFKNQILKKIAGEIKVEAAIVRPIKEKCEKGEFCSYIYYVPLGALLILLVILFLRKKKKRKKEVDNLEEKKTPGVEYKPQIVTPPRMTDIEGRERKDFPNFRV